MEGRSQHKSQEMGSLELRGKQTSGVRLLESNVAKSETKEASGTELTLRSKEFRNSSD
jgi:hypothetical protein